MLRVPQLLENAWDEIPQERQTKQAEGPQERRQPRGLGTDLSWPRMHAARTYVRTWAYLTWKPSSVLRQHWAQVVLFQLSGGLVSSKPELPWRGFSASAWHGPVPRSLQAQAGGARACLQERPHVPGRRWPRQGKVGGTPASGEKQAQAHAPTWTPSFYEMGSLPFKKWANILWKWIVNFHAKERAGQSKWFCVLIRMKQMDPITMIPMRW